MVGCGVFLTGLALGLLTLIFGDKLTSAMILLAFCGSGLFGTALSLGTIYAYERITEMGMSQDGLVLASTATHVILIPAIIWACTQK